ncbi:unnamed protein product [Toxocara canis]|uniref:Leuk-A4-hydro_C domain-containing protein n=1 Tax=Toxocara canis TaxID=6265 RepID=A0A183UPQ9_TOXCA|nr:unnamed protein product [Toxocara canis]
MKRGDPCSCANFYDVEYLDVKELAISSVSINGTEVKYRVSPNSYTFFGSTLKIYLPKDITKTRSDLTLLIKYSTSREASALQWLRVAQTADKLAPYLFSQCESIHARSLFPCMDTPSVKQTYDAQVRVESDLTCLMSALSVDSPSYDGDYTIFYFRQPMPIPSYLFAIVVGRLVKRDISDRCAVWAEPSLADRAKYEFAKTEEMLCAAEEIAGKYLWGRYDIVCMPPSFPYGGMENPCLTFITPTIIAGDRSLSTVVAHEMAHSWAGNLVTSSTWEHFWLNEGFATFIERKICGRLVSEEYRQFMSFNGWFNNLKLAVRFPFYSFLFPYTSQMYDHLTPKHAFTKLVQQHDNIDPDTTFSVVPYEKGSALLLLLEQKLTDSSTVVFEDYIKDYIRQFSLKSIDSYQWKDHLYAYFDQKRDILDSVDFDKWFDGVGMPPDKPHFDMAMVEACESLYNKWICTNEEHILKLTSYDFDDLIPFQQIEFLSRLWQHDPPLELYKLNKMNELYRLNESSNFEILYRWIRLAIKGRWEPIIQTALSFLSAQGRMKYCRPVYKDLMAWPATRALARENFLRDRTSMHHMTAEMIAKDLHMRHPAMSVRF